MLVLHAEKLPDATEFFRAAFGVEPDFVLFFQSPTQGGWNGASFQGACFRALRVDEFPRGTFDKLFTGRPLKVLECNLEAAQTVARSIRVNRGHGSLMTGVHSLQHVECFFTADFAYDDSVRTHAEAVDQQLPLTDGALALYVRGPRLEPHDVLLGERQLRGISSEAARKAQEIIGKADAEATRIYGRAFGADPEFYAFFRTLESYDAIGENTTLMIKSDSDFFRYLESTGRRR